MALIVSLLFFLAPLDEIALKVNITLRNRTRTKNSPDQLSSADKHKEVRNPFLDLMWRLF